MATNKYPDYCKDCGVYVPAGKGILTSEWSNYKDEVEWVVRHADKSICAAVKAQEAKDVAKAKNRRTGMIYLEKNGKKTPGVIIGEQLLYDGRRIVAGDVISRTGDTVYLAHCNGDPNYEYTYVYTGSQEHIDSLLWTMELL